MSKPGNTYFNSMSIFFAAIFLGLPALSAGQSKTGVHSLVAKVIEIDSNNFIDQDLVPRLHDKLRMYYYAIKHFKIVTPQRDTSLIAVVFDIKRQLNESNNSFGIEKDSVYKFDLYRFCPCNSDFPGIWGCSGGKDDSLFIPYKRSIVKKSYKEIDRIIDYTLIDYNVWNELWDYYKY